MAEEKENKVLLEREYIVPLRHEWLKVPYYKRANKAVKALKEFIVRHMKIYDRDLRKVKIDVYLNNEIRFRGMKYPPAKIKVKAIKNEDGTVSVKLTDIPKIIEYKIAREARKKAESFKKVEEKKKEEKKVKEKKTEEEKIKEEEKGETDKIKEEEKKEIKEKEESSKIAEENIEKKQAKKAKHEITKKQPEIFRKSLKK